MLEKARRLAKLQWQANLATGVFSAVAIGLAFARLTLLAQLMMLPVTIGLIASVVIAYQRYQLNKVRRDEVISQLDAEQAAQLRELFNTELRQRGSTSAGSRPPGIKKRGGPPDAHG